MPTLAFLEVFGSLRIAVIYVTLIVGAVATLFSVIYLGGRVIQPRTVRARLRAGAFAAILLIMLAALDIYLAIIELTLS